MWKSSCTVSVFNGGVEIVAHLQDVRGLFVRFRVVGIPLPPYPYLTPPSHHDQKNQPPQPPQTSPAAAISFTGNTMCVTLGGSERGAPESMRDGRETVEAAARWAASAIQPFLLQGRSCGGKGWGGGEEFQAPQEE